MCLQKPTPISVHQSEDSSFSWRWARSAQSQGRDKNSVNNNDHKNNTLYSVLSSRYFFNIQKDWIYTLSKGERVSLTESHACLQPLKLRRWWLCQSILASRQPLYGGRCGCYPSEETLLAASSTSSPFLTCQWETALVRWHCALPRGWT